MNFEVLSPTATEPQMTPSFVTKLLFWIIMGALSVFFAEVVVASDPYPFFHAWGIVVVVPLYLLHILVLGRIAFKTPRLTFGLLFFLGIIFGLYEAYITKVLWDPPWGPFYYLGGIAPVQTIVLTLWWHPWMAFIVPLLAGETFLTGSREVRGTFFPWLQRQMAKPFHKNWLVILFLVAAGLLQSSNASSIQMSVLSFFSTGIVIAGLIMVWRSLTWGKTYSMRSLMPEGQQFWVMVVLLAGMYGFLGTTLRADSMAASIGQITIAVTYAILAILVVREIRISRPGVEPVAEAGSWSFVRAMSGLALVIAAAAGSQVFLGPLRLWIIPIAWLVGGTFGIIILVWVVYRSVAYRAFSQEASSVKHSG